MDFYLFLLYIDINFDIQIVHNIFFVLRIM